MDGIKKIIVVHHTHTDIGYTGVPAAVAVQHIRHLRAVLEICRKNPEFRWTIESGWPLDTFLSVASEKERKELEIFLRKGQIELTGFYNQPLTQLCNLEELCTSIELNCRMADSLKAGIDTLMIDDIGGLSYNIPQIAKYYGIKYIVNGCGGWRVMLPFTTLPHLFYLTGADGSRVLYYHIGDDRENWNPVDMGPAQYGFGHLYLINPVLKEINNKKSFGHEGRRDIDRLCKRLENDGYPFDTILMQAAKDNGGYDANILKAIDLWNRHYRHPEIKIGTCREFFEDIQKRYPGKIPLVKGELTCSWTEHAITNAFATGCYRQARRLLAAWSALETSRRKKTAGISSEIWRSVMKNFIFYGDHTCGLSMWGWRDKLAKYGSLWSENFNLPRYSWEIKTRYAQESLHQVNRALERQSIELSAEDACFPETVSFFNPHSFTYDGPVEFITRQSAIKLLTSRNSSAGVQSRAINSIWYLHKAWLKDIPSYGVEVCRIVDDKDVAVSRYAAKNWTLKGPDISVKIDAATGAVVSLRTRGKEWVDSRKFQLNDFCYFAVSGVLENPTEVGYGLNDPVKQKRIPVSSVSKKGSGYGKYTASMLAERRVKQKGNEIIVETEYIVDGTGLRIRNRVRKIHQPDKEACYFAFPFRMEKPYRFDVEQQGQVTRFPEERLPGASNHNLGMQDFISISDNNSQAVLTSMQACLIALGKPSYYHFGLYYRKIESPAVFSYAFNNLWNTNCPLHQQGDLVFEYHIACLEKPYSPLSAYHVSRKAVQKPLLFPGDLRKSGFQSGGTNLLSISTDNVMVDSIRPEENGICQLRLVEIAQKKTSCAVTLAKGRFSRFALREDFNSRARWRKIASNRIALEFRPAEFKTILLK